MIIEVLTLNLMILNEIAVFYLITDFIENKTRNKVRHQLQQNLNHQKTKRYNREN
jgi:hypothetical protein